MSLRTQVAVEVREEARDLTSRGGALAGPPGAARLPFRAAVLLRSMEQTPPVAVTLAMAVKVRDPALQDRPEQAGL